MTESEGNLHRRLAALVAIDLAGYSRLVADNEDDTVRVLSERRALIEAMAGAQGGRVANTAGDGVLLEFGSVVAALRCALEFQRANAEANADRAEERRLDFRTGVHLGEIVAHRGDLFGDGVNVAARLQALAAPGQVLVSERVRDEASGKAPLTFEDHGYRALKNIPGRWRVFAARDAEAPDRAVRTREPGGLPSIAVLPFANLSAAPGTDYFAEGVVEEIITALSRVRRLFVIARASSFSFRDCGADPRDAGRELGVDYVLHGTIRWSGARLRITGQLVEVAIGVAVWAERFEGSLEDVFSLQDEVTAQVVGAIAPHLLHAEALRAARRPPGGLGAYDLFLRALPEIRRMTREGSERALALLREALDASPDFAVAAALAAWAHTLRAAHGWRADPEAERAEALALAARGLEHGQDDSDALAMAGYTIGFLGEELDSALIAVGRALELNPNSALAHVNAGWLLAYRGRADEAEVRFRSAARLSPRDPDFYRLATGLAFALLLRGEAEAAAEQATRAVAAKPGFAPALRALTAALHHCGRPGEARSAARRLLEAVPDETIAGFSSYSMFRYSGRLSLITDGLRSAGVPD